jgi:hypothetical protein
MTSKRKTAANRSNSRNSCGPRTAAGRINASRNALRHGLTAVKHRPATHPGEIEYFARALCGDGDDRALFDAASAVAKSEMALRAIRAQQLAVMERSEAAEEKERGLILAEKLIKERDKYEALEEVLPDLIKLDRYERQAWSRQMRAMRDFMNVKLMLWLRRTPEPSASKID